MNPKVFFKIEDGILIPTNGQSPVLDALFTSNFTKKNNKSNYNDFTKSFIEENSESQGIYFSENYSYDPIKHTFNFITLENATSEDISNLNNFKTKLDPNKTYYAIEDNIKNSSVLDIKKSIKNEKINFRESNKTFLEKTLDKFPKPSISECGMHIEDSTWNYLIRNILKHRNTMLIGPTGTGKTEIVMNIAKILNIPCYVHDMGAMQDPLTDLLGSHRLENGSSIFDYAKFTQEIQEPCIIVLDELSRAPLMANNILFPCLDSRRELPVEIADSKSARNIKIHPECVFIATANIGAEYAGTNDIDAALFNRFLPLQLDYLSAKNEISVLTNRTNINKDQATKIVNFANRIRKEYSEGILSKSCSTRETIAIAELVEDGFSYSDAFRYIIIHKYHNPEDEEIAIISRIMVSL